MLSTINDLLIHNCNNIAVKLNLGHYRRYQLEMAISRAVELGFGSFKDQNEANSICYKIMEVLTTAGVHFSHCRSILILPRILHIGLRVKTSNSYNLSTREFLSFKAQFAHNQLNNMNFTKIKSNLVVKPTCPATIIYIVCVHNMCNMPNSLTSS